MLRAPSLLIEHDPIRKPVATFPDHALVVHEQRENNNDRKRNSEQPKQRTSTETHVSLHPFELT
jgi:hypothetical protein